MDMLFRLWTIGLPALSGAWFDAWRWPAPVSAPVIPGAPSTPAER